MRIVTTNVAIMMVITLHIHQKLLVTSGLTVLGVGHERITERGGEGPPGIVYECIIKIEKEKMVYIGKHPTQSIDMYFMRCV
jgi:hypothetical protein